jgi:signal peptidase II
LQIFKYPKLWWLKILVGGVCFSLDYVSKEWARTNLPSYGSSPLLPNLLQFTLVTNTGAAFNLGSGHGLLMTLIATAVTVLLVIWVLQEEKQSGQSLLMSLGAGFLIGGALGNLFDRFARGRVTDFLEFTFVSFPVFNIADVCIDVGIGLIIIFALTGKRTAGKGAVSIQSGSLASDSAAPDSAAPDSAAPDSAASDSAAADHRSSGSVQS